VADVHVAVAVGPGDADEDFLRHGNTSDATACRVHPVGGSRQAAKWDEATHASSVTDLLWHILPQER
jgi:hypothetical protein